MPVAGELHQRAAQPVDAQRRVALDQAGDAQRLGTEDVTGGGDGVAADVHQAAAADVGLVAHVAGIGEEIGEERLDRTHLADPPTPRQLPRPLPLRMVAHHKRLGNQLAAALTRSHELPALLGVQRHRLLAQHVLAGFERAHAPGNMQVVGQRDVDRLDVRVGQQRLVATVGLGNAQLAGDTPRPCQIARGDGINAR